jgi:hypothetical protein
MDLDCKIQLVPFDQAGDQWRWDCLMSRRQTIHAFNRILDSDGVHQCRRMIAEAVEDPVA